MNYEVPTWLIKSNEHVFANELIGSAIKLPSSLFSSPSSPLSPFARRHPYNSQHFFIMITPLYHKNVRISLYKPKRISSGRRSTILMFVYGPRVLRL